MAFPNDQIPAQISAQDFWQKYVAIALRYLALSSPPPAITTADVTPDSSGLPVIPVDYRVTSVDAGVNYNAAGNIGTIPVTKRSMSITNLSTDPTNLVYVRKGTGATSANANLAIPGGGRDVIENYIGIVSVAGDSVNVQVSIE